VNLFSFFVFSFLMRPPNCKNPIANSVGFKMGVAGGAVYGGAARLLAVLAALAAGATASPAAALPGRWPALLGFQQLSHAGADSSRAPPATPRELQGCRSAPPGSGVADASASAGMGVPKEWRREYARRSEVNGNFQMMRGMVQATWVFVVFALPLAIRNPGLQYQAMGGACRMLAGATTGAMLLGGGQQLLQSSISAVMGLPDCWRHVAVPLAAVSARAATGFLADALVQGPFFLDAPARAAVSRFPGGALLNLVFLGAGMHHIAAQRSSKASTPLDDESNTMPVAPVLQESLAPLVADRVETGGGVRIGIIGGGAGDGCPAEDGILSMARAEDGRMRIGVIGGGAGDGCLAEEPAVGMEAGRPYFPGADVAILAASSAAITNQKPAVRNRHVYRPPRSSGV